MDENYSYALKHTYLGFNRENFKQQILDPMFHGSIKDCAEEIGIKPQYLRDIFNDLSREVGTKTLSMVYRFCVLHDMNPYPYIFVVK